MLLAALTVAAAIAIAAPGLIVLGVVLALVGLPLNPSLTTISLLVDSHVSASSAAEAFGWLSTGIAGGAGVSSALAGAVSHPGDRAARVRRRRRRRGDGDGAGRGDAAHTSATREREPRRGPDSVAVAQPVESDVEDVVDLGGFGALDLGDAADHLDDV